jgi:peptidoglycan-associated lipoprotein
VHSRYDERMLVRTVMSRGGALVALTVALAATSALGSDAPRSRPAPAPRPAAAKTRLPARPVPRPQPTPTAASTPRPPDQAYDALRRTPVDEIDRLGLLLPVYFAAGRTEIRAEDDPVLEKNAAVLKRFDFLRVTLEAHCDTRGDVEYNMRLGEQRLKAVLKRMIALGVPASRMQTVSFGKEVPLCTGTDEDCLARSRRVHFAVTGKEPAVDAARPSVPGDAP